MPNPKRRTSSARRDRRRSHHALEEPGQSVCPNCQEAKLAHRVCPHCGFYRGKQVVAVEEQV